MPQAITIPQAPLAELCRRHGIARLSLFGSALHGEMRPESDIDLLVEFLPGQRVGYLGLAEIEIELAELLGRRVDLRTPAELSHYFRQEVQDSAEVLFAAA